MNRSITFKVWDINRRKMMFAIAIGFLSQEAITPDCNLKIGEECNLLQFTGLTDKKGNPIYEGDILDNLEVVVFSEGSFMTSLGALYLSAIHREVIGNIYENLELIK